MDISIESHLNKMPKIADKIRFLDKEGWSRSDIARKLGKRYQHVRNVLERNKPAKEEKSVFSPLMEKLRKIAEAENQPFQTLLEEALRDFIEKKRGGKVRPEVMTAYRDSLKEFDALYRQLAK